MEIEDVESDDDYEVHGDKCYDEDLQIIDDEQMERNTSHVAAVERNKSHVAAVERNKSQVTAVERNKSHVAFVERNKSRVAAVERNMSHVDAVERNTSQVAAVERNKSKVGGSRVNRKNSPKKRSTDGLVGVMERLVQIKEKEARKEVAQEFTITRCMEALKTLEGVTPDEKITALEVFENAHNREFFVNLVDDKDGTAILWFRRQLARLT
jgi:precorrin-6B methylase 2